jgi:predicted nucleic acid-binding protein
MIRAIVDTNVLVAAFAGPADSAADAVLAAQREGEFELVISPRILAELDGVLNRPALGWAAGDGRAGAFVRHIADAALFAHDVYDPPRATADRSHDFLVAVARATGVRYIVTSDSNLSSAFVRGIELLTPLEFVTALDRAAYLERAA